MNLVVIEVEELEKLLRWTEREELQDLMRTTKQGEIEGKTAQTAARVCQLAVRFVLAEPDRASQTKIK